MAIRTFRVTYERDRDGWWVARIPELPGCNTQGRTLAEAQEEIRDALASWTGDRKFASAATLVSEIRLPKGVSSLIRRTGRALNSMGLGPALKSREK